jgi:heme oxygenase
VAKAQYENLRARLRGDTRHCHAALDDQVTRLDQQGTEGYARFLLLQWRLFAALEPVSQSAACAPVIRDLTQRAGADLEQLGRLAPVPRLPLDPHPLAVDYVVSGSRLGAKVLRKRWLDRGLPETAYAGSYLSAPPYMDYWRGYVARAEALPAGGAAADRIVTDATGLFEFCLECIDAESAEGRAVHA